MSRRAWEFTDKAIQHQIYFNNLEETQNYIYVEFRTPLAASGNGYMVLGADFLPKETNKFSLGSSKSKWSDVYIQSSAINGSDERIKQNIETYPDELLDAWEEIEYKEFLLKDSVNEKGINKARIHAGLIAQDLKKACEKHGIDPTRYGFFCFDKWEETQEVRAKDTNEIIQEYQPGGEMYSLRYEEALCIEAAYQRRENQKLKNEINEMKERLSQLEVKLS